MIKPLNIMLPKTSAYEKSYDEQTKWMYFLIEDDDLLKNITLFWIKSHDDEVTYFCDKEIPKADSNHTCLEVTS